MPAKTTSAKYAVGRRHESDAVTSLFPFRRRYWRVDFAIPVDHGQEFRDHRFVWARTKKGAIRRETQLTRVMLDAVPIEGVPWPG